VTANRGASETRREIILKMDRLEKSAFTYEESWIKLRQFINGMAKRAGAKKGGLGKR